MKALERFTQIIDRLNENIGKAVAWCTFFLMLVVCFDVIRRFLVNETAAWILELEWHLFALVFLLGAGYTFLHDRHVRVDVFYSKMSERDKSITNIAGIVILLLPWCALLLYRSWQYAWQSFVIGEGSPNPNGLPALWLIKFAIPLGILLLALQALSELGKNILRLQATKTTSS